MAYRNSRPAREDDFDDETVSSDADSYYSRPGTPAHEPAPLSFRPMFCVEFEDGDKPVYEAWGVRIFGDEFGPKSTFLGTSAADVDVKPAMQGEQGELAKMHLDAIAEYQRRNKGLVGRVFRRKSKTYEQHIDERCRKLPLIIQDAIYDLLERRGQDCSTRYRTRTWTVAVMRQRERFRFARTELAETKRHRLRFWKNTSPAEYQDYHFVIRGSVTAACADPRGFSQPLNFGNPWVKPDAELAYRMCQERDRKAKIAHECRQPSPSPPSYRNWRGRSASPDDELRRMRYRSPPSYRHRHDRSPSPEPETEAEARRYIRMTRAAARSAPPSVPMAPEPQYQPPAPRYAPPPLTRSPSLYTDRLFSRPRIPYVEDDSWSVTDPYDQTSYPRPSVRKYAPHHFGFPTCDIDNDSLYDEQRDPIAGTPECIACQVTPECGHYSRSRVCDRPVNWRDGRATHPPCFICMAMAAPESRPNPFGPALANLSQNNFFGHPPPVPPCANMGCTVPSCMSWTSSVPPPYPPTERAASANGAGDGEGNDLTDIESDGGEQDDGERTAVGESPQPLPKEVE